MGRSPPRHVRGVVGAIGTIQLDAINVVERTQFLVLFSRLGAYDVRRLHDMTKPLGELFEYWGHAASLLPMIHQPLFRWRMEQHGPYGDSTAYGERRRAWYEAHADYINTVLAEIRDRGPLAASQLSDPRRRNGEWWDRRSVGRQALEWLFHRGDVAAWRTRNFERVYDVPERVIPAEVLARPTPTIDDAHRQLLALAAHSLGMATVRDLADYYRIDFKAAKLRVAELVENGELLAVNVDGWRELAYVAPGARPTRPRRTTATLLSPFDSLVWERARTSRLFAFDYRIEVYVPQHQRTYGYYVLPLLLGDQLVGRFNLKADRRASALQVDGAYHEPSADAQHVAPFAIAELRALQQWLGLATVTITSRGNLAKALRRASA
jgi:uncharacterized protein YcaQ